MNLVVAHTSREPVPQARIDELAAMLEQESASQPTVLSAFGSRVVGLVVRDPDSRVVGVARAQDRGLALVLVGSLDRPLPGWNEGSPVDSPDRAAAYILARYREEGLAFLTGVHGSYSMTIVDHDLGQVVVASDPGGLRTVFHAVDGGNSWCSTSLRALVRSMDPRPAVDRSLEDFFLCHGFYPWARTMFQGVRHLAPGRIAQISAEGIVETRVDVSGPWPDLAGFSWERVSDEEAVDVLHSALVRATEEQTSGEPRAAVLLGGFDSALVASLLQRLGKKVDTYSFSYENASFNQTHTDTLARYLGIEHHWVPITKEVIADGLTNYSLRFNFPTNWMNYVIQTQHVCQRIRQEGIRYIYSGDGCDGTFLGYPRTHIAAKLMNEMGHLPKPIVELLIRLLDRDFVEYSLGRPYTLLAQLVRSVGSKMPERGFAMFRVMDETSARRLRPSPSAQMSNEEILRQLAEAVQSDSYNRLAYAGKNALSPNKAKLAGSSDSCGVVVNTPYLHQGMKRLALGLPDRLLRPDEKGKRSYNGKYILCRMAEAKGLLPNEVIYQKKISAVDAPVDSWYAGPLNGLLREILRGLPFEPNPEYLDYLGREKRVEQLYTKYVASDALTSHALSLLATYASFTSLV